jgi:histidyl-tRNA synthetase
MNRNLKKQLEYADTLEIPFVVIVGPEELKKNKVKLKDMVLNKEMEVKTEDLVRKIKG